MRPPRPGAGFTLLEVLVALTIASLAVVSLIELSAQGVRLLKQSSEHQRAVELADRIVRDTEVSEEGVDTGEEDHFAWERTVALVPMPEEIEPPRTVPGREGPRLFAVSVAVRWGRNQGVEVATLRAPVAAQPPEVALPAGEPAGAVPPAGAPPATPRASPAPPPPGARRDPVRSERGFTMLELLIALAILGAMVGILFGGLRVGLRAWQRGEEATQILQHSRSLTQVLEQALMGIHAYQGAPEPAATRVLLFQGEADRVAFVTVAPPVPLASGIAFTAVTLAMQDEDTPGARPGLVIRERILPNFQAFEEAQPALVDPTTTAIRFRYLRDTGGGWEETWDAIAERALPRGIEITVTTQVNGQAVEQPPIVVPIRAVAP